MVQQIISDLTPKTDVAPMLSIYLVSAIGISAIAVLSNILCAMIAEFTFPMPWLLQLLFVSTLDVLVRPMVAIPRAMPFIRSRCANCCGCRCLSDEREAQRKRSHAMASNETVDSHAENHIEDYTCGQSIGVSSASVRSNQPIINIELEAITSSGGAFRASDGALGQRVSADPTRKRSLGVRRGSEWVHECKNDWLHLAYNLCRVCALLCFAAKIFVFVRFLVPLLTH